MTAATFSQQTVTITNAHSRELADKLVEKLAAVLAPYDTYRAITWPVGGSFNVGVRCPMYMESTTVVADVAGWLLQA